MALFVCFWDLSILKGRDSFHPLVHSLVDHNTCSWARTGQSQELYSGLLPVTGANHLGFHAFLRPPAGSWISSGATRAGTSTMLASDRSFTSYTIADHEAHIETALSCARASLSDFCMTSSLLMEWCPRLQILDSGRTHPGPSSSVSLLIPIGFMSNGLPWCLYVFLNPFAPLILTHVVSFSLIYLL